jgi:hypothetical protein
MRDGGETMTDLTTAQLCFLRCLDGRPFEACLYLHMAARCGLDAQGYEELVRAGLVVQGREIELTREGRRAFRRARVGRYF